MNDKQESPIFLDTEGQLQIEMAKKEERNRIQVLYENMGCVPEEDNCWYRFWQALKGE